jgi:microcompartment protein CcmL/EutN
MTSEEQTERRLKREADTLLKTIKVGDKSVNVARVEVTYQRPGDIEHAGHLVVVMPGDVDPWQMAREQGYRYLESLGELEYSSVDDIYAI